MQTKSKQKPQKVLQGFSSTHDQMIDFQSQNKMEEFIECGAICNDGTYTHINGRGAGSRHGGVKHKLYAKKNEVDLTQIAFSSKISLSTNGSNGLTSKSQKSQQTEPQNNILTSNNSKKKTQGKIKLKQLFKTKAKRIELFDKVHLIFEKNFKDLLQFSHEQIQDDNWLLFASISSIYDELQEANETIKELQSFLPAQKISSFQVKEQERRFSNEVEAFLRPDMDALRKQNKEMAKQILKISKENTKLQESLNLYKIKEKNFKKMLKIIERSDPTVLNVALQKSKINIKDLKSLKQQESKVVTRSMAKKSSKKQQKKKESIFSSDDSSDFYDEDNTIRNIIKSMK